MAKREPHNAVRGVDPAVWKRSVTLAANQGITHGQYVTKSLRTQELADQEPITGEIQAPAAAWSDDARLRIIAVEAAFRLAERLAAHRPAPHTDKVPRTQLAAARKALRQVLATPNAIDRTNNARLNV